MREREKINAKQAQRKSEHTDEKKKERRPREIALASQGSRNRQKNLSKKAPQFDLSIFIFSKIIFSLLRYKSAHNRIPRTTLWRRRRSAQNTRVCHSPPIATTVDDFFDTSNAVVEVVVFRSPHQKSFNLAKRDVVARIIFAFKLRNVVSSPERFFFFTAP